MLLVLAPPPLPSPTHTSRVRSTRGPLGPSVSPERTPAADTVQSKRLRQSTRNWDNARMRAASVNFKANWGEETRPKRVSEPRESRRLETNRRDPTTYYGPCTLTLMGHTPEVAWSPTVLPRPLRGTRSLSAWPLPWLATTAVPATAARRSGASRATSTTARRSTGGAPRSTLRTCRSSATTRSTWSGSMSVARRRATITCRCAW